MVTFMSEFDGKIIEVDFKKKQVAFKFGYKTNTARALEVAALLDEAMGIILECDMESDFNYICRKNFNKIVEQLLGGI